MAIYPQPETFPEAARMVDGVWAQPLSARARTQGRPALFLDRDGVLVEEGHYLSDPDQVRLTPNAAAAVRAANAADVPVILVTNQAGIGYGYFKWEAFIAVQARILEELARANTHVDGVYACPFHEKAQGALAHKNHPARKPNPGMLEMARDDLGVVLARSWIVGDRASDLLAGKNGGCKGGVHVLTGHGAREGEREAALALAGEGFEVKLAQNLGEAVPDIPLLNP